MLVYTSQPYVDTMDVQLAVPYISYNASSRGDTGNIITFPQFEEGNLLSETRDNKEIGNEYDCD